MIKPSLWAQCYKDLHDAYYYLFVIMHDFIIHWMDASFISGPTLPDDGPVQFLFAAQKTIAASTNLLSQYIRATWGILFV
jgi:hypothetical protein